MIFLGIIETDNIAKVFIVSANYMNSIRRVSYIDIYTRVGVIFGFIVSAGSRNKVRVFLSLLWLFIQALLLLLLFFSLLVRDFTTLRAEKVW